MLVGKSRNDGLCRFFFWGGGSCVVPCLCRFVSFPMCTVSCCLRAVYLRSWRYVRLGFVSFFIISLTSSLSYHIFLFRFVSFRSAPFHFVPFAAPPLFQTESIPPVLFAAVESVQSEGGNGTDSSECLSLRHEMDLINSISGTNSLT